MRGLRICSSIQSGFLSDRTVAEHEQSLQAALGLMVWRRKDGSDAFWNDCVGPSGYAKGQGKPIKVWGMLSLGRMFVYVLEQGENANQDIYSEIIEEHFDEWLQGCTKLVCDFERCLRMTTSIEELDRIGVKLIPGYPRCSQDFNAMENAWDIIKQRLDETIPKKMETRDQFLIRYMDAVRWVNQTQKERLWHLCTNQKERAMECLANEPPGARTRW